MPGPYPTSPLRLLALATCLSLAVGFAPAAAQPPASEAKRELPARTTAPTPSLPPAVLALLARAGVPAEAVAAVVLETPPESAARLSWRAQAMVNPASTLKLVTTFAALDLLGPAHTWKTVVLTDGPLVDGVLKGNLYLQGGGDPKLVSERLWLLMRRIQGLGIQRIAGNVVLDHRAWNLPDTHPGDFDGEPLRPYNAAPDALLVNYRAQVFTFTPDAATGVARVTLDPPLAGVDVPATVPLALPEARSRPGDEDAGACGDWRGTLRADFSDAGSPRFLGRYPLACGERQWPIAHPDPARFAARAVAGMWRALGGLLDGEVRDGPVPGTAARRLVFESPPLAEVVRDTNKFSNNVLAQHLFLSLADPATPGGADFPEARRTLERWWSERLGSVWPVPVMGNGSGLNRDAAISAGALARLLQLAWNSGLMPDLVASLPASGLDGTLRRSALGPGMAHLKTGSLRDVQALAGYVHGRDGRRSVLVAIVNHPNARAARPALEALVRWSAGQ
jgi:serine-type D-Ala-D-Ala carboxypeptidase/endopeptidase (penicillin-binding protein 4)